MESARERLARFVVEEKLSQAEAGQRLGCSQALVSKILRGDRTPGLDLAFAIERATEAWADGPIRAKEWTTLPEPQVDDELAPTGTDAS